MTARKGSRREIKSEINIVSLLDVLLILLLIFMMTTPIITQSVEVNLPDATESKIIGNDDNPPVIIEVLGIGQYNLLIDNQNQKQIPSEQVISEAHARIIANPKTVFLIGGAKDVPYDEIMKALNLLYQAGVKSIGLMTQPI